MWHCSANNFFLRALRGRPTLAAGGASPVRVVRYYYYQTGDVANIIIKDEGVPPVEDPERYAWHRSLAFYYTTSGQVWQVLWDRWQADEGGEVLTETYERLAAREFRYDAPRARYLSRPVNPVTFQPDALSTWEWTDYAGDEPYGDFSVALDGSDFPVATDVTRYLGGFGTHAKQTVAGAVTTYLHADLIGSTVLTTDAGGAAASTTAYTAWGERVTASSAQPWTAVGTRYAFSGGWGYESGLITLDGAPGTAPITLQHLGARWYQPEIGRFVQRDPIGLRGGNNCYVYCENDPLGHIDPDGNASMIAGGVLAGAGFGTKVWRNSGGTTGSAVLDTVIDEVASFCLYTGLTLGGGPLLNALNKTLQKATSSLPWVRDVLSRSLSRAIEAAMELYRRLGVSNYLREAWDAVREVGQGLREIGRGIGSVFRSWFSARPVPQCAQRLFASVGRPQSSDPWAVPRPRWLMTVNRRA